MPLTIPPRSRPSVEHAIDLRAVGGPALAGLKQGEVGEVQRLAGILVVAARVEELQCLGRRMASAMPQPRVRTADPQSSAAQAAPTLYRSDGSAGSRSVGSAQLRAARSGPGAPSPQTADRRRGSLGRSRRKPSLRACGGSVRRTRRRAGAMRCTTAWVNSWTQISPERAAGRGPSASAMGGPGPGKNTPTWRADGTVLGRVLAAGRADR